MPVTSGNTYFIVVDGWVGDCGEYHLDIFDDTPPPPCVVDCPAGAIDEGEGPLFDGYVDDFNGGCNSDPNVFSHLTIDVGGCTTVCGIGGYFLDSTGALLRDTDWYEFVAPTDIMGMKFQAEGTFQVLLVVGIVFPPVVLDAFTTGVCDDNATEYSFSTVTGATYWIWVGAVFLWCPSNDIGYVLSLCGFDVVETESTTWGSVKSLFR